MQTPAPLEFWSTDRRFGARIAPAALDQVLRACEAGGRCETGGILVGTYSKDSHLAIVRTASVGTPDSRSGSWWFVRGVQGLRGWLERLWKSNAGHYIGEWHFHPGASPSPSKQDVKQMRSIARDHEYQCAEPLLLILGGDPKGKWRVHVEVHTRAGARHELIQQLKAAPQSGEEIAI